MKKRTIIVIVVLVILGTLAGGYFWYFTSSTPSMSLTELVPDHALVVYGSDDLKSDFQGLQEHPAGEMLAGLPFFHALQQGYAALDSMGEGISFTSAWLKQRGLVSVHKVGRSGFDFLLYSTVTSRVQREALETAHNHYVNDPSVVYKKRTYEGFPIHQFEESGSDRTFYYCLVDDFFVGSFTGYLLEDVIRHLDSGAEKHFFAQHPILKEPTEGGLSGRWWINLKQWPELMNVFLPADQHARWPVWGDVMQLDMVLGDELALWSGFTPQGVTNEPREAIDIFQSQPNGRFRLLSQLPTRTAWAFHWQLDKAAEYNQALYQYHQRLNNQYNLDREAMAERFLLDYEDFLSWIGPEVAMTVLESVNDADPDRVYIMQASQPDRAEGWLKNVSVKVSEGSLDSLYVEQYRGQEIRLASVYNLPGFLFGSMFDGFQQTFYAKSGQFLVLGNTAQAIRRVLDDWATGQVLGKSVQSAVFLENTLQEGVCGWYLQAPRAWDHALATMNGDWREFFQAQGLSWRGMAQASIQFRKDANRWFTAVAIKPEAQHANPDDRIFATQLSHQFQVDLITPPYVVRNHHTRVRETMVQDANTNLALVNAEGEVLWQDSLGEPLVSDITQIDFFNNGKLQYFFATNTKLHVVDRNGRPIEGWPISMQPNEEVTFAKVIDYDGSKRYRFVIATRGGGIYLYDKSGFPLEGWSPRIFSAPLAQSPFHVRVGGTDRLVVPLADGHVAITNRRGEMQEGFPLDMRGKISSPLFVQLGTDLDDTYFKAVTDEGELITFTMAGKVTERKQLIRPSREAAFSLVPDVLGQTFLIGRMSEGQIGILDEEGNELFQKEFLTSGKVLTQFYRFGAGKEMIVVTDVEQDFSYVFDYEGNLVNYRPLDNSQKVSVLYYERTNTFHVYTVYGTEFSVSTFQP